MSDIKLRDWKILEEDAKSNPKLATELKRIKQGETVLSDYIFQKKTQEKKDRDRELILIGSSMLSEAKISNAFRDGIEKILDKHLVRTNDRKLVISRGWKIQSKKFISNDK